MWAYYILQTNMQNQEKGVRKEGDDQIPLRWPSDGGVYPILSLNPTNTTERLTQYLPKVEASGYHVTTKKEKCVGKKKGDWESQLIKFY